ncbi:hypothetical protein [Rhizobium rhizogenes]|uniref:hypothetical protein n=1 Tax=Rhizobium rhizogenes TaxID=359 RepID=UPI001574CE2D|nr:hypothetical protein [Rhizobium rhizogenes]NTH18469.1 hypothetical protein [Rhizobium rhizogenes]NTH31443.1 hypothetical protein [Rhizobium rhizogenes]
MRPNILVTSITKTFFANKETGANIGHARYGDHVITRFDLEEFKGAYGTPLPERIDIIDLGYWYRHHGAPADTEEAYEPPVWHMRQQGPAWVEVAA